MATSIASYTRHGVSVAALAALAVCGGGDKDTNRMQASADSIMRGDTAVAAGDVSVTLTDPNIASLIATTNSAEIVAGDAAATKAENADVKAFARMMVREHQAMQRQVDSAVRAASVTPQASTQAETMRDSNKRQFDSLNALKGDEFDRGYVATQVAAHEKALNDLRTWQSQAQSPELRAIIEAALPKVQDHLDRARALRSKLGGAR